MCLELMVFAAMHLAKGFPLRKPREKQLFSSKIFKFVFNLNKNRRNIGHFLGWTRIRILCGNSADTICLLDNTGQQQKRCLGFFN